MNENDIRKPEREGDEGKNVLPLGDWLSLKLDIPSDIMSGGMRVELRGRNSMTVHGCRKILGYSPDRIILQMKNCVIEVRGSRLVCISYLAGAVGIEGRICALTLDDGGDVE